MANPQRARTLRQTPTWATTLMWRWLRDRRFCAYKFRREQPVGPYYLDFFCPEANLSIELDGRPHGHPDQQKHDVERTRFLAAQGIKELRFWNSQLRREPEVIRNAIFQALQERVPHPLPDYTRSAAPPELKRKS